MNVLNFFSNKYASLRNNLHRIVPYKLDILPLVSLLASVRDVTMRPLKLAIGATCFLLASCSFTFVNIYKQACHFLFPSKKYLLLATCLLREA